MGTCQRLFNLSVTAGKTWLIDEIFRQALGTSVISLQNNYHNRTERKTMRMKQAVSPKVWSKPILVVHYLHFRKSLAIPVIICKIIVIPNKKPRFQKEFIWRGQGYDCKWDFISNTKLYSKIPIFLFPFTSCLLRNLFEKWKGKMGFYYLLNSSKDY